MSTLTPTRPPGLPPDAELASTGGFNEYVGPLWRLPDEEQGAVTRFAFVAEDKHMNGAGTRPWRDADDAGRHRDEPAPRG